MRPRENRRPLLSALLAPVVLAAAVAGYLVIDGGGAADADDAAADLCAEGAEVTPGAYLVDLRKPVDAVHAALPGQLLKATAGDMEPGTELAVYALSPHAEAPRTLIGRLCKSVDPAALANGTSKHRPTDDCDVPAQAPAPLRAQARDFCRQRDALARRVDALVVQSLGQAAGAAYLVEALEATAREFGDAPGTLAVFSDLQQHARWYSHPERGLDDWNYADMAAAWAEQPMAEPLAGFPAGTAVTVHYVPRTGSTEQEDWRAAHLAVWQDYFAGAELAFEDAPVMAEYVPASLAEAPNAMELAAYELERLRHSTAEVERERAGIERERAEIESKRAETERQRAQIERDRRKLDDERLEIEAERARLAAEREELAARTAGAGPVASGAATEQPDEDA